MTSTSIDLSPLVLQVLLPLATLLGGFLATWLAKRLATWLNLQNEGVLRESINNAIKNGLALAQSELKDPDVAAKLTVDVRSRLVHDAYAYVMLHEPAAAKALGFDEDSLRDKIAAHLALNTTPADKSVAVPSP